jgi:hypothetical protein
MRSAPAAIRGADQRVQGVDGRAFSPRLDLYSAQPWQGGVAEGHESTGGSWMQQKVRLRVLDGSRLSGER